MRLNTSPFKFLDSYEQDDLKIFFGREEETEALYDALSGVKHLLVYGPSGAGKTSLIECGLRNQFSDADWYALSIRKGANMLASTFAAINQALKKKLELDEETGLPVTQELINRRTGEPVIDEETGKPKVKQIDLSRAIQKLYSQKYQPIYLLFDQFEELLISGNKKEKEDFFREIDKLIRYRVPCRVLFIMREEFIGHLSEFEELCPSIFEQRFRLEKMTRSKVERVIQSILEADYYKKYFKVEGSEKLAEEILKKLPDTRSEIDLSHVQVYLSELWDRTIDRGGFGTDLPIIDKALIKPTDNLSEVLDSFLKKQLNELDVEFKEGLALEVLAVMISERNTKLQLNEGSLRSELKLRSVDPEGGLLPLLDEFEDRRIVRKVRAADQVQYEISHDTLARVVGSNLSEEMKLRQTAQDYYRLYREREGRLSREDINLLRFYEVYLPLPKDLERKIAANEQQLKEEAERRIREAEERAEKERGLRAEAVKNETKAKENAIKAANNARRAQQRTLVAGLVAILAMVAAFVAFNFFQQAESGKVSLRQEIKTSDSLRIEAQRSDSVAQVEKQNAVQALADFKAEQEARMTEQEKREAAEQQKEDAEKKRKEAESKNIDQTLSRVDDLVKAGYPAEAKQMLEDMLKLFPNNQKLQNKLNGLK